MSSFTAFAIAPSQNTGTQHDANGAFHPGAQKFANAYNAPWRTFENTGKRAKVQQNFYDTIDQFCPAGIDLFAYFGHGIPSGLPSPHIYESDLDDLVRVLLPKVSKPFVCVLYACSAGAANGFSGKLREKLGSDVWVYAHTTVGHSYMNPDVSEEMADNTPSYRLLYPYGSDLRAAWSEALHYTDLWLRYPLLYDRALAAEVNARRLLGSWEVTGAGAARHLRVRHTGRGVEPELGCGHRRRPGGHGQGGRPEAANDGDRPGNVGHHRPREREVEGRRVGIMAVAVEGGRPAVHMGVTTQTAKRLNHAMGHGTLQG